MDKKYKLNKEWLDLMLENKNNTNLTFNLSDNDTRILLTYIEVLQQKNQQLKIQVSAREEEYKKLEDKLSKIETLIINHNCDTGDIYYKYNSRFLKSELKERILEILYEKRSNSNE